MDVVCVLTSSSYKDSNHIGLGNTHIALSHFNHLFKGPVSKYSYIPQYCMGLGLQHMNLGGQNSAQTPFYLPISSPNFLEVT